MATRTLCRLSGLALLIALPLQILAGLLHPPSHDPVYLVSARHLLAHVVDLVSWVLVLLGLSGLYARQAHRAGIVGLIGFILAMLNAVSHIDLLIYESFVAPMLARDAATRFLVAENGPLAAGPLGIGITLPLLVLGILVFGVATIRARRTSSSRPPPSRWPSGTGCSGSCRRSRPCSSGGPSPPRPLAAARCSRP